MKNENEKNNYNFGDTEIKKQKFHQYKRPISIKNMYINKIVYLIRSLLLKRILNILLAIKLLKNRLLCIFLPKISAYKRDFYEVKYMSFLIKDNELLEKYKRNKRKSKK